jgi:DNA transformation protein
MPPRLEDLPNIGRRLAADLRAIGIATPGDLREKTPIEIFRELEVPMGRRHDPCVFYTLLAVEHFFATDEARPWWDFTARGKAVIARL